MQVELKKDQETAGRNALIKQAHARWENRACAKNLESCATTSAGSVEIEGIAGQDFRMTVYGHALKDVERVAGGIVTLNLKVSG